MFGLKTLYARHLSRKGEHATALAMCDLKDIYVLSRAGMHLTVLELSDQPSIERALALAHIGQIEAAIKMARLFVNKSEAKALLGYLAVLMPTEVADLASNRSDFSDALSYCECAIDPPKRCAGRKGLSPLHTLNAALCVHDLDLARYSFERLYAESALKVPETDWAAPRLEITSLTCEADNVVVSTGPLITVILTAYNEELLLQMAIHSIQQQSWRNLELLIVDDGSHDGTYAIARLLAERDHRIRVIRLPNNVGTWQAKNIALQEARGEFITMHDADDWSHPSKLTAQITQLILKPEMMCTSSYFFRIDEESGRPYTRNANSFVRWNPSSLLFRRAAYLEIGPYREDLLGGDCEFAARIESRWGTRCHGKIRKPLAVGLQRCNSLSNKYRFDEKDSLRLRHWEQWRREHVMHLSAT